MGTIPQGSGRAAIPSIVRLTDNDVGAVPEGAVDGILVSVSEAKAFINLDHSDDDAIITSLIHAAESYIESCLNRDLRARNYQAVFTTEDVRYPETNYYWATGRPAASVSAVKMWNSEGVLTTLDGMGEDAVYAVRNGRGGELIVAIDTEEISKYSPGNDAGDLMLLEFSTVDASSANLKGYHAIKRAAMHIVAGGYEARESEMQGPVVNVNPAVDRLLCPYIHNLNIRGM